MTFAKYSSVVHGRMSAWVRERIHLFTYCRFSDKTVQRLTDYLGNVPAWYTDVWTMTHGIFHTTWL